MIQVTTKNTYQPDYFFLFPKTAGETVTLAAAAGLAYISFIPAGAVLSLYCLHKMSSSSLPKQASPTIAQIALPVINPHYHPRDLALPSDLSKIPEKLKNEFQRALNAANQEESNPDFISNIDLPSAYPVDSHIENIKHRKRLKTVGVAHAQGARPSMEDEHIAKIDSVTINGKQICFDLFSIIDGHAGDGTAKYIATHLHEEIKLALAKHGLSDEGIFCALKEAFVRIDARAKDEVPLTSSGDYAGWHSGAVAVISMKIGNTLWTANLGDSRAVLAGKDFFAPLSEDAKPDTFRFKKSIEQRGGWVWFPPEDVENVPRVNKHLAAARAFNDQSVISANGYYALSPRPKITKVDLTGLSGPIFLIQACDGIWDVASSYDVVAAAHPDMPVDGIARRIVQGALNCGSTDNCSALVSRLI